MSIINTLLGDGKTRVIANDAKQSQIDHITAMSKYMDKISGALTVMKEFQELLDADEVDSSLMTYGSASYPVDMINGFTDIKVVFSRAGGVTVPVYAKLCTEFDPYKKGGGDEK